MMALTCRLSDYNRFLIYFVVQVVKVWPERGAVQVYNPKGQDKLFTYDAAYDCTADTQTIYDEMVSSAGDAIETSVSE